MIKPKLITLDTEGLDYLLYRGGSGNTVEIVDIAVGTVRGAGRGRMLVGRLIEEVIPDSAGKMLWAMTRSSNENAHNFYQKCGFHLLGVLHKFYITERDDAYVYGMELPKVFPERKIGSCE